MLSDPMNAPQSPPDSFHSQHAPFGAFASFTLGLVGSQGGFGQSLRGPARQNIYVGFRLAGQGQANGAEATWRLLPFFTLPESTEVAFTGEAATAQSPRNVRVLAPEEYQRTLGWASDTWRAGDDRFGFCLLSPFSKLKDPATMTKAEARKALSPHINGWIELDNSQGSEPAEIVFGVGESDRLFRPLQDTDASLLGFAAGPDFGYATSAGAGVESRQGFDVFNPKFEDFRGLHLIGGESALIFTVPAGRKKRFPLVLGFFQSGIATTGITAHYAYTRYFRDLEDVLGHGLAQRAAYEKDAAQRDRELQRAKLDEDQRFLIAQATHSYLGSSQLLWDKGSPLWVVNEGEYRMMNTFDLTVDHLFFELEFMPWAVRNALDLFAKRYAYTDKINVGGRAMTGGISFTHDMGVMNNFTPAGHSSYECDHLRGCFSHMTMEQLLNWVITAVTYAESAGDKAWLRGRRKMLVACAESLHRRDNPVPGERDGILKFDSLRCGLDGAEITTYDSLDVSLGQARNNLYLAVKTLGAWVLLEQAFSRLGMKGASQDARATADLLAASIGTKFDETSGTFPAVFEADNQSRIIPAIEGFVYPLFLGLKEAYDRRGRFGELMKKLSRHLSAILRPGVCLDAESGGWKMSSTSHNTWFSKIAIAQHVVRKLFPEAMSPEARAADRVHAQWQRQPGCGANAMCDQIHSTTGVACGSRYYPRGVTTLLWLRE
jgi:hypothetical protein